VKFSNWSRILTFLNTSSDILLLILHPLKFILAMQCLLHLIFNELSCCLNRIIVVFLLYSWHLHILLLSFRFGKHISTVRDELFFVKISLDLRFRLFLYLIWLVDSSPSFPMLEHSTGCLIARQAFQNRLALSR